VVIISVFWVGAVDGIGFHHHGYLLNWSGIPVSIGLFGFCYSGHAVFPNIYTSLKNQADFDKILGLSFLLCTLLYAGVAVMGFTMFGEATASQITLNLPGQFLASKIAVWTTVVNPFTKYALTITPVAHSLEELLPQRPDSVEYRSCSILIRTALVLSTIAVAVVVPYFGLVMAFIGSFLTMTVSVILPCACYLSILGKKATISQVVLCSTMILIGVLCLIGGTYSSIAGIIESLYHGGGLVTP
jgi:vesicular inhibitory amino acid transporter